jgi:hypothetical protein
MTSRNNIYIYIYIYIFTYLTYFIYIINIFFNSLNMNLIISLYINLYLYFIYASYKKLGKLDLINFKREFISLISFYEKGINNFLI